jgi:hypothetical protein
MPTILVVKALMLVTFLPSNAKVQDTVNDVGTIRYGSRESTRIGRKPWATESLNASGSLPAVVRKGF